MVAEVSGGSTRAAIYCRISDDREGERLGVQRQEEDCRARAVREGFEVVGLYVDNDISASTKAKKRRPEFERMMADARMGRFDAILSYSNSRLTRRPRELEDMIDHHAKHGTRFLTVVSGDDDLSTANGRRNARIKASIDAGEAEETADRVRRAKSQAALAGKYRGGPRPFGYRKGGMKIKEQEAEIIREMTHALLAGRSLRALVAELNARKVPTPRGKEWSNKTLKQVVVRPRNAGLISTGPADRYGMEILGKAQWPAIVDEDTFLAVRDMLMEPSRRSSFTTEVSHLGSGLYLCGRCGAPLRPGPLRPRKGATKDEPTRFQYRCTENLHLTITEEPTDEYVRAEVAEIVRDPRIVAALGATQNEEAAALMESDRRQRNVLSARLAKFEDDYSQGLVSGTQLAKATARVKSEMEEVDRRISEAVQHSVASPVFSASDPGQAFLDSPIDVQRLVLASVAKVEILPSGPGVKWSTDRIRISPVSTAEAGDP